MNSPNRKRARRGVLTAAALSAIAVLALASFALAHGRGGPHGGPDTGTIASFDSSTDVLTIELTDGSTVSGLVTRRTKIRCEDEKPPPPLNREGEPGDDRGHHGKPGEDEIPGGPKGPPPGGSKGSGPSGHDDNGSGANCSTADLVAGAAVHSAKLELRGGKAIFREVELADPEDSDSDD